LPAAYTTAGCSRSAKYHRSRSKKCTGSSSVQLPTFAASARQPFAPGRNGCRDSWIDADFSVPIRPVSSCSRTFPQAGTADRLSDNMKGIRILKREIVIVETTMPKGRFPSSKKFNMAFWKSFLG